MVIMCTKAIPLLWPNEDDELQFSRSGIFLACCLWDDAVGSPAFQKQLIFFGTALRSLPGGALVSASGEEHIDWYFIVRKRLM